MPNYRTASCSYPNDHCCLTGYLGSLQLTIGSEKVGRNDQRFHLFLENVAFVLTAAKFNQPEQSNFSLLPKITFLTTGLFSIE
jgi:hypothetical protein